MSQLVLYIIKVFIYVRISNEIYFVTYLYNDLRYWLIHDAIILTNVLSLLNISIPVEFDSDTYSAYVFWANFLR